MAQSLTPMTDMLESGIQHMEAQLPATRQALSWEHRRRCDGLTVEDERPDRLED